MFYKKRCSWKIRTLKNTFFTEHLGDCFCKFVYKKNPLQILNFPRQEVVVQRCFVKEVILEISHRPAPLLKNRLSHRCFPVNFVKPSPFFHRIPLVAASAGLFWFILLDKRITGEGYLIFFVLKRSHTTHTEFYFLLLSWKRYAILFWDICKYAKLTEQLQYKYLLFY